ncbi:hypothetical protein EX30DRAFT_35178 [Ascodesmis nigricans]|uniref:Uncharacterized protein n=1 Tax=Ascodesmis nigricans TaxID=341454 RepID=A0A4V6RHE9_9PEZI|nr:hypothetical protein EX30DRAFT_35178 [Ascodesmis nigricans]
MPLNCIKLTRMMVVQVVTYHKVSHGAGTLICSGWMGWVQVVGLVQLEIPLNLLFFSPSTMNRRVMIRLEVLRER